MPLSGAPHRPIAFSFHKSLLFSVNFFQDYTLGVTRNWLCISVLGDFRVVKISTLKMVNSLLLSDLLVARPVSLNSRCSRQQEAPQLFCSHARRVSRHHQMPGRSWRAGKAIAAMESPQALMCPLEKWSGEFNKSSSDDRPGPGICDSKYEEDAKAARSVRVWDRVPMKNKAEGLVLTGASCCRLYVFCQANCLHDCCQANSLKRNLPLKARIIIFADYLADRKKFKN